MPTRIFLRLLLLAGLVAPICAFALGIGSLEVRSALDQNFEAEIPLIVNNPAELTNLKVQLPLQQAFDATGVERLGFMSKLRFAVQSSPNGPSVIKITSTEPIREPSFMLLVDLTWSHGHLLREFPVQLDPALYANRYQPPPPPGPIVAPPPIVAAPADVAKPTKPAAAPPALPPAPQVSFEGATPYGPVKSGETLATIARQVRPSTTVSLPQMMSILVAGNPGAFANGNPSSLRVGAMLKVPTAQALGVQGGTPASVPSVPPPGPVVAAPPAESTESAPAPMPSPAPSVAATAPPEPATSAAPVAAPEPPPVVPPAPPVTPAAPSTAAVPLMPVPASPAEQPRELFPQSSLPAAAPPAATPPTESTGAAAPATPEPAVPAKPPEPAKPAPVSKPLPVETEAAWWDNPVVWVAILLIVLAVAAMLLVPLLRRPARAKAVVGEEGAGVAPREAGPANDLPRTRPQLREPTSRRPLPATTPAVATALEREVEPVPTRAIPKPAAKPAVAAPPKPIEELLKDIDFGLEDRPPPVASGKEAAPGLKLEAKPLPDVEPSTASITREPSLAAPPPAAKPELPPLTPARSAAPPQKDPPTELPSALRFDDLDFSFGDLGLEQTARSPSELPPLEMKPAAAKAKAADLPLLSLDDTQPFKPAAAAKSAGAAGSSKSADSAVPAPPSAAALKFEFTDITQEVARGGSKEDLRKLEEDLQGFGDTPLTFGKMDVHTLDDGGDGDGVIGSDYVETKLDLATTFLDMGDQVGARGLLEDVLREGDSAQKKRAGELLKKLS